MVCSYKQPETHKEGLIRIQIVNVTMIVSHHDLLPGTVLNNVHVLSHLNLISSSELVVLTHILHRKK